MKGRTLHTNRRKPSIHDANSRVSGQLTDQLIRAVQLLPESGFKTTYLKEEFLSKFVSSDTDPAVVRRQRAINKWLSVESDNAATNVRLLITPEEYNILPRVTWRKFLRVARKMVIDIIGVVPQPEILVGSFSGGASTSRLRTESHPASKYLGRADVTAACQPWFELALDQMPGWAQFRDNLQVNLVRGNVLFTVPKTTTIDRCAAKEPDLNMFLQKGVGNFFRSQLRRVGINLNDQSRNQRLAREGSITGALATMDLSSASDSVTCGLVQALLPPEWFDLLNCLRSPITIIDGEEHVNEMFSSMGNGFTFELESLLFYVLARATAYCTYSQGIISVYGDDIIVPAELFDDLEWVLSFCGFSVNTKKSYKSGPFRESCGGHYYNGYDVTPFYLRAPIFRLTDLIGICNRIRRCSQSEIGICDPDLEGLWLTFKGHVPSEFWGGTELGSDYQLVSPDPAKRKLVPRTKIRQTGDGGYIHWLNATDGRGQVSVGVSTSTATDTVHKFRSRPSISSDRPLSSLFLHEV